MIAKSKALDFIKKDKTIESIEESKNDLEDTKLLEEIILTKEREDKIVRDKGAVFLMQIGNLLSDGKRHDGRSPDYDDWELNGDILVWFEEINMALELSSMGIRVDRKSLTKQLQKTKKIKSN